MTALNYTPTTLLDRRYLSNLVAYLKLAGWKQQDNLNWYEFLGARDVEGDPLLLVLPRNPNTTDANNYIEKAITLLSAILDEPVQTTAQRIQYYHSDVVIVTNLETGIYSSISLKLADVQVSELKQLVLYGARTEREPRPYFHTYSPVGQRMLEQFRFAHTVRGSFGLTVEAPIVHDMELYASETSTTQLPLLSNLADYIVEVPINIPPFERRIVERLVRGLMITRRATGENSIQPLIKEYGSGFSGNMCAAVVKMGQDNKPIEYRVLWSPKLAVSEDLHGIDSIRLNETSYFLLKEATQEMKVLEPEVKRIRGIVTHIGSNVPPMSEGDQGRQVIIRWIRDDNTRTANIIVPLSKEQYLLAHNAHIKWATVEVTGVVERVGSNYRLIDARDFAVTNP